MAISFGRNLLMSIGKESTYNTYLGTGHQCFNVLAGSTLRFKQDIREEASARDISGVSPYDMTAGLRGWEYDCTFNMPKEGMAHWLSYVFGALVESAVGTFYKRIISVNKPALGTSPTPPSLSLRLLDDNREWQLSGGVITEFTITMRLDNFWQCRARMVGGSFTDTTIGSAPSPTAASAGRWYLTSDDFEFWVNQPSGSASNWLATDFEVTFRRSYADAPAESYASGSKERVRLESAGNPAFDVTGYTRRIYDGITQFDLFDAYTQFRVQMYNKVVSGENLVAVDTSSGYAFKLCLEKCYLTDWYREDSGGLDLQRLEFKGTYTTSTDIQITTQDSLATPDTMGTP